MNKEYRIQLSDINNKWAKAHLSGGFCPYAERQTGKSHLLALYQRTAS
ncbi:hypothetical protein LQZ18_02880 [Lachnospiraceae bacterium ZAX-1]